MNNSTKWALGAQEEEAQATQRISEGLSHVLRQGSEPEFQSPVVVMGSHWPASNHAEGEPGQRLQGSRMSSAFVYDLK